MINVFWTLRVVWLSKYYMFLQSPSNINLYDVKVMYTQCGASRYHPFYEDKTYLVMGKFEIITLLSEVCSDFFYENNEFKLVLYFLIDFDWFPQSTSSFQQFEVLNIKMVAYALNVRLWSTIRRIYATHMNKWSVC